MAFRLNARRAGTVVVASATVLAATACGSSDDAAVATSTSVVVATVTETTTATSVPRRPATSEAATPTTTDVAEITTPTTPTGRSMNASQRNAVAKGREYLSISAFSRQGLIDQLQYEGFSADDAAFAADSIDPDWTEQARKKAAEYMELSAFSEQGLVEQLVYEGFTQAQAAAGAASQF